MPRLNKRTLIPIPAILLILLCTAFYNQTENPEATSKKLSLRVLCYNIHHASPPADADKIDLDAIAKVINDQKPDLVALQEVDVHTKRSGPFNQAHELGQKTGLTPYFFKAIDYQGGEYGVAILSRYPVTETNRYPLPRMESTGGEPRVLGTATVLLPGKRQLIFASTHLDAQRDSTNRLLQIKAITALLRDAKHPVVIAGDFNAPPGTQVVRILDDHFKRTCGEPCAFTIPVNKPNKAIDFIAFSPAGKFQINEHKVIQEHNASDHLPVFSILEVNY